MHTFVDLFCGLGLFHQAFAERGWKCVLASDIDPSTHAVYQKNHGMTPRGDIYKIKDEDIPEHDILCAGFPCQAFSHAGKHLGFDDARGVLFLEIIRFVRARKPKILALENVPTPQTRRWAHIRDDHERHSSGGIRRAPHAREGVGLRIASDAPPSALSMHPRRHSTRSRDRP